MSGFEPTQAQTGVGYNMFTLIDPDAIPYPETDTWSLNYAAETIRSGGEEMASLSEDMETTWQGLQEHYTAPESETLFAAVEPVVSAGEDLQGDLATVATALEDLAEAAAEARRKLNTLKIEAQSFARDLQDRKTWWLDRNEEDDEWAIETNLNLKSEVNSAWSDFTSAEIDCANAISGIHSDLVFTDPDAATGAGNELVYGESGQFIDLGDGSFSEVFTGTAAWQLDNLTEWAGQEFHPGDVEFEDSSNQAAWDTLVVGLAFGTVQGLATKSGYWRPETGWSSNSDEYVDNLKTTWKETGMEAASLVGIHNEDGWLYQPSTEDPHANLSWDWWWGNIEESGRDIREGHTAWSQRESDPEYHETYTAINTVLLIPGAPVKVVKEIITFGGPDGSSGSGGAPDEPGTGANPFSGQGGGAPGTGGSNRDISDIAEEGRTPITERLDDALEQTPVLGPEGPGPGAPGGSSGPSEPSGPGAPDAPGGPPRQDPPNQGTGTQEGPREGGQSPRGDQGRERPGTGDQRDREGATPPATGGGSDAPGDGRGSGTQDREGPEGTGDSTRPRGDQERPRDPTGQRDDEDRSGHDQRGGTNQDGEQRGRHDEDRKGPEAETGGGGSDRGGGDGPPPTSPGDESGQGGSDDEGREDGSDGGNGESDQGSPPLSDEERKKSEKADNLESQLLQAGLTNEQIIDLRGDHPRLGDEWQRVASAVGQQYNGKIVGEMLPRTTQFALDGASSPREFAYRYEYYKATFDELVRQIGLEGTGKKLAQEQVANQIPHMDVAAQLEADHSVVNEMRGGERARVDTNLPPDTLQQAVREQAGNIDFGHQTGSAYHGRKHYKEILPDEKNGNVIEDYLNSTEQTIKHGTITEQVTLEGGSERLTFRRPAPDESGNHDPDRKGRYNYLRAFVIIKNNGDLVITTHGNEKVEE
ncbi:hypothetical protein [Nocardiopsis xinjiangensis]|uniref:hypothetical protein n=1 Tax=Nocardiopsis xinjiangensis TaxID=124285 RepID=UPI00034D70B9|nr:hypothetical protein [Nocardiopsis xinjiangensis]